MAYMSQDLKKKLVPGIKAVLAKYGVRGTIGVQNHSTLTVNLKSGQLDIIGGMVDGARAHGAGYVQVNEFWIQDHYFGIVRDFLLELRDACNDGNHDNSDPMVDHFDVGWYLSINVGRWDRPYVVE